MHKKLISEMEKYEKKNKTKLMEVPRGQPQMPAVPREPDQGGAIGARTDALAVPTVVRMVRER